MDEITICRDCNLKYVRGDQEDDLHHDRYHDEAVNGPKVENPDGYYTVNSGSPLSIRLATGRAAVLAKRDADYDFPSYVEDDDDPATMALILVLKGRIVALIVSRKQQCCHTVDLEEYGRALDEIPLTQVPPHSRTAVEMIWLLKANRGSSVAMDLVQTLAKQFHMEYGELAHLMPFTDAALKFWRKLGITTAYVI